MKKNQNNNKKAIQKTKFVFHECFNFNEMKKSIITETTALKMVEKIIYEVKNNPLVYKFNDICEILGILPTEFMRLAEKFPVLKEVYNFSLLSLGNKRERGGLKNELNAGIVNYTMAHYDKDWKKLAEEKAELAKKQENDKYQTFKIEMAPIDSSNLVPEKKNNETN